ncbi:hypothetical protein [Curtobacterium sp. NPDC088465]|uniref:hypothetical protein n=1 Tax=Curtobacterium sp. NPDC088465 TaxID=3363967 RepID=UPI00381D50D4
MGNALRGAVVVAGAVATVVALSGCSVLGAGTRTAEAPAPSASATTAATPGTASCDLASGTGSVSIEETADAYRVEWSGVPTDDDGARQEYQVQLGTASQDDHITMYIEFDSITGATTYGWFDPDTLDVDPVPGDPDTSAGTVVGVFPKQRDIDASYWSPSWSKTTTEDSDTTYCTEDGQVLDWTPLD